MRDDGLYLSNTYKLNSVFQNRNFKMYVEYYYYIIKKKEKRQSDASTMSFYSLI